MKYKIGQKCVIQNIARNMDTSAGVLYRADIIDVSPKIGTMLVALSSFDHQLSLSITANVTAAVKFRAAMI